MIIDLQRRLAEVGRIRIGQQVPIGGGGKTRPAKLDTFRLTSPDRQRIHAAATLYGGTPQEWDAPAGRQWEVVTDSDRLPVICPPSDLAFTQWYELWSGGGCQRRCDGRDEMLSDGPCMCDPEQRECTVHSRLSVMLRDLVGLGLWRLDTQGWNAALELQGAVEVMQLAAGRGQMLPAQLRLEQRMVKRAGEGTRRFAVPVLDIEISPAQLLGGTAPAAIDSRPDSRPPEIANGRAALTPVPDTVPERPTASVADQALGGPPPKRRGKAQQTIPATGLAPRTVAQVVGTTVVTDEPAPDDDVRYITPAQLTKLSILLNEAGYDDRESRHDFVAAAVGHPVGSAKDLTLAEASTVIDILESDRS